jgi:hypothetical protein
MIHNALSSYVPPPPPQTSSSSSSSTQTRLKEETELSGVGKKCGEQGEGGKDCLPFHRYDPISLKKDKPIFDKCCRPCMEKFSGELSLLQIPNHVKHKVLKRFTKYHEHFYKLNAPINRKKQAITKQQTSPSTSSSQSLLEITLNRKNHLNGKKTRSSKGGKSGKTRSSKRRRRKRRRRQRFKLPKPPRLPPLPKPKPPPLPQPKPLGKLPKPGAAQGGAGQKYLTGEEFLRHVRCCSICPEQFYLPADFDDFNANAGQDDEHGAALFLEEEEVVIDNDAVKGTEVLSMRLKKKGKGGSKKQGKAGSKKQGKTGGKKAGKTGTNKKRPAGYIETKPEVVGGPELVDQIDKKQIPVDTKVPTEACCNICPSDEPSEGDVFSNFKPGNGGTVGPVASTFLETMSKNKLQSRNPGDVNIMGPSMVCCPVCPTLHELSHGLMEPLGGIFGLGKINMHAQNAASTT